ncbi:uncharacterized protein simc1 isoform X1 [Brachyistius frenatus]|uniref:uncharacterized protein simc1 isoform X1 n=1 Tax=Brachyistius frenatus TaxID=100188 RepID=UPI0037E7FB9B
MDDVITLSSDDSDVEVIGSYKDHPLPLSAVRVNVDDVAVNIPQHYIDLKDPRWALPGLHKSQRATGIVVDLSESKANETHQETKNLPPDDCQVKKENANVSQISNKQDVHVQKTSLDSSVFTPQQDCGNQKEKPRCLKSKLEHQKWICKAHPRHCTPVVMLTRLPFLETHVMELITSRSSVYLNKDCTQMSLRVRELNRNREESERISNLKTTITSDVTHSEPSFDDSPPKVITSLIRLGVEENSNGFTSTPFQAKESQRDSQRVGTALQKKCFFATTCGDKRVSSSMLIHSPIFTSLSQEGAEREVLCSDLEKLESEEADSTQSYLADPSPPHSSTAGLNSSELFCHNSLSHTSPISRHLKSQVDPPPASERIPAENKPESQLETESSREHVGSDNSLSFLWQGKTDEENMTEESRFGMDTGAVSRGDRHFVCPVKLRKIMAGRALALIDEDDEDFRTPVVLCRQSLSLVYNTIEVNYPEGTLQLLSDLIQPGHYPPRDITSHLLHDILLDTECPHHFCVQAFNLLMRTQRHHIADKTSVPWDWELLASVMDNQDHTKRHRCDVVRMFLEYVVQSLEDDFHAKRSTSTLHHSIAKATLSCDLQFPRVREVIKWLFSAIMKSTEHGESRETTRERDEQIRMVSVFQRMLTLALEVDRSPALNSAKLSQELFHMLISNALLRAHRMLLLESLQSGLLRCKLLEHLLDYVCPLKVSAPMSLSLLLHFLKNCSLAPDPTDGAERWQKWEEVIHLLWMLLLGYNKAMKGYLCSSFTEQRSRVGPSVYKPDDIISKLTVCEAVAAFLSRSQADLGQALPRHVKESLICLQRRLLDVCQS